MRTLFLCIFLFLGCNAEKAGGGDLPPNLEPHTGDTSKKPVLDPDEEAPASGSNLGYWIGGSIAGVMATVASVLAFVKRDQIQSFFQNTDLNIDLNQDPKVQVDDDYHVANLMVQYNKIINHLYLGTEEAALNILKDTSELKPGLVISVTDKELGSGKKPINTYKQDLSAKKIEHEWINIADNAMGFFNSTKETIRVDKDFEKTYNENDGLMDHLSTVLDEIDKAIKENKDVLVHCTSGQSRSAAVVIAYLMKKKNMSYENAFKTVKTIRPQVEIDINNKVVLTGDLIDKLHKKIPEILRKKWITDGATLREVFRVYMEPRFKPIQ